MSKRKRYSIGERKRLVDKFKSSGESFEVFSTKMGISKSSLQRWIYELTLPKYDSESFIEVGTESFYELELGALRVKIPTSVSTQELAQLVSKLNA